MKHKPAAPTYSGMLNILPKIMASQMSLITEYQKNLDYGIWN